MSFGEEGSKTRCEWTVLGTGPGTQYVFGDYSALFFSFPSKMQDVGAGGLTQTVLHSAEAEAAVSPPAEPDPCRLRLPLWQLVTLMGGWATPF